MEHVRKVRLSGKQRLYLVNNLRWDAVLLLADEMKVPKEQIKDGFLEWNEELYEKFRFFDTTSTGLIKLIEAGVIKKKD